MTITIGCLHHSFYEVQARVVAAALERAGHVVEIERGGHAALYPKLADGAVDLMVASWLPHLHAPFFDPVADRLVRVVPLFEGAGAFWAVPAVVPADAVASVADLRKPEVHARMEKRILAPAGAVAVTDRARAVYGHYRLGERGYGFEALESDEAWAAEVRRRHDAGVWFATPLWRPHYLNKLLELRALEEPEALMGGTDTGWLTANRAALTRLPAATVAALEGITIGLDAVMAMDLMVNVEGLAPAAAAERWTAHPSSSEG